MRPAWVPEWVPISRGYRASAMVLFSAICGFFWAESGTFARARIRSRAYAKEGLRTSDSWAHRGRKPRGVSPHSARAGQDRGQECARCVLSRWRGNDGRLALQIDERFARPQREPPVAMMHETTFTTGNCARIRERRRAQA
jgi:hypothetical protein